MDTFKSFEKELYSINESNFEDIALKLFRLQARENRTYKDYITNLGVNVAKVGAIQEIPFLPISFFKTHKIVSGKWKEEVSFESSGTTASSPSRHFVKDINLYLGVARRSFELRYGNLNNYHILALLPSYLERKGSSLVSMIDNFIKLTGSKYSSFYLNELDSLQVIMERLSSDPEGRKILLWGVSFALLDLAERAPKDLRNVVVMETGGMKGRRRELTREELHGLLKGSFNVLSVQSEYGMTELMSQAYTSPEGYFVCPPWMKTLVRDINDPFSLSKSDKSGGINVIDLANIYTCAFIETQDLGKVYQGGNFEVLGRIDNSDIRGCNLLV
ncbi:MAG: acyl transferase [Cyclobacteriaceae bacterium]